MRFPRIVMFLAIPALLFGAPWWLLVYTTLSGPWFWLGTAVFLLAFAALPTGMLLGHGPRQSDTASKIGDTLLGVMWVVFTWSVIGAVVRAGLILGGVDDPARSRIVAIGVVVVAAALVAYAVYEARRLPRVRTVEVPIEGLGAGLDGVRLVVVTDTHFAALDRLRWSERVVAEVNAQRPDIACHAGDLADGSVAARSARWIRSARSRPRWAASTSPAITSTSVTRRAGSSTWPGWAGSRCATSTRCSPAAATA